MAKLSFANYRNAVQHLANKMPKPHFSGLN